MKNVMAHLWSRSAVRVYDFDAWVDASIRPWCIIPEECVGAVVPWDALRGAVRISRDGDSIQITGPPGGIETTHSSVKWIDAYVMSSHAVFEAAKEFPSPMEFPIEKSLSVVPELIAAFRAMFRDSAIIYADVRIDGGAMVCTDSYRLHVARIQSLEGSGLGATLPYESVKTALALVRRPTRLGILASGAGIVLGDAYDSARVPASARGVPELQKHSPDGPGTCLPARRSNRRADLGASGTVREKNCAQDLSGGCVGGRTADPRVMRRYRHSPYKRGDSPLGVYRGGPVGSRFPRGIPPGCAASREPVGFAGDLQFFVGALPSRAIGRGHALHRHADHHPRRSRKVKKSIYNHVCIMGVLASAPTLDYSADGSARSEFLVSVHWKFRDMSGRKRDEQTPVRAVARGSDAERVHRLLGIGSPILVDGRLAMSDDRQMTVEMERMTLLGRSV